MRPNRREIRVTPDADDESLTICRNPPPHQGVEFDSRLSRFVVSASLLVHVQTVIDAGFVREYGNDATTSPALSVRTLSNTLYAAETIGRRSSGDSRREGFWWRSGKRVNHVGSLCSYGGRKMN